jgi:anti-sigma factor RsiW
MRCGTARQRLSDDIDGALSPARKVRLEAHLASCPDCRAYRDDLVRLQAEVLPPADRTPEDWAGFDQRLERKLAATEAGRGAVGVPFGYRRSRAWAAAGVLVIAGAAIWFALLHRASPVMEAWMPAGDALAPLLQEAEADPQLENALDREIVASIEDMTLFPDADVTALSASDPLFWEGLSEDELASIAEELAKDTGRGGPK